MSFAVCIIIPSKHSSVGDIAQLRGNTAVGKKASLVAFYGHDNRSLRLGSKPLAQLAQFEALFGFDRLEF